MKLNKFFSLLFVISLIHFLPSLCTAETAQVVTMTKIDGGPYGYNYVSEMHNSNGQHDLFCKEPGYEACEWNIKPPSFMHLPNNVLDDMVDYADQQMDSGTYSGTYYSNFWFDNHCYSRSVTWNGIEVKNSIIQVLIQLLPD